MSFHRDIALSFREYDVLKLLRNQFLRDRLSLLRGGDFCGFLKKTLKPSMPRPTIFLSRKDVAGALNQDFVYREVDVNPDHQCRFPFVREQTPNRFMETRRESTVTSNSPPRSLFLCGVDATGGLRLSSMDSRYVRQLPRNVSTHSSRKENTNGIHPKRIRKHRELLPFRTSRH